MTSMAILSIISILMVVLYGCLQSFPLPAHICLGLAATSFVAVSVSQINMFRSHDRCGRGPYPKSTSTGKITTSATKESTPRIKSEPSTVTVVDNTTASTLNISSSSGDPN